MGMIGRVNHPFGEGGGGGGGGINIVIRCPSVQK